MAKASVNTLQGDWSADDQRAEKLLKSREAEKLLLPVTRDLRCGRWWKFWAQVAVVSMCAPGTNIT